MFLLPMLQVPTPLHECYYFDVTILMSLYILEVGLYKIDILTDSRLTNNIPIPIKVPLNKVF